MKYKLVVIFTAKLFGLILVLGLLIGHGSDTGPIVTVPGSVVPCDIYIRKDQPYHCIDGEDTEQDIAELEGQTTINGDLIIENTNLTSLEFLTNVSAITGRLTIVKNKLIATISSIPSLAQLESLRVMDNPKLADFKGLNNISEIPGRLVILNNESLLTLEDFDVGVSAESVEISNNATLQNVAALRNLVTVQNNFSLSSNRLSNLSDLAQIQSAGNFFGVGEQHIEYLYGLENLQAIEGTLFVNGDSLLGLDGLTSLTTFGALAIVSNPLLTTLNSLPVVPGALESLVIEGNDLLSDISRLSTLTGIVKFARINNNSALSSLQGLNALTSVGDSLNIADNAALNSLSGLSNLQNAGSLVVERNAVLTQLGLTVLSRIEDEFTVRDNVMLCLQDAQDLLSQVLAAGGVGVSSNTTAGITISGNRVCP